MTEAPATPSYDLLTGGETLLRLSPPGLQRLEQARLFETGIGGSELNVGCVLARLGRQVAWVSRLPEGPLGRIVDGEARRHGVDTRHIRWVAGARLGLMFFEPGPAPRDARAVLGFAEQAERLAEAIAARYGVPLVAVTRPPGEEPGDLLLARGEIRYAPRYPVEIVDRIGAGDSFVAGLIHGLLDGDLDLAIRLAAYAAAVALATPGDISYFGPEDLAAFHADAVGRLFR